MVRKPKAPRLDLDVTTEIIDAAKVRDSSHCMIAEAIVAAYPGAVRVSVDIQTIRFSDPAKEIRFTYLTPRVAQKGILRFDRGDKDIDAFRFQLRSGQVTTAGSRASDRQKKPRTEKQKAAAAANMAKTPNVLAHAALRGRDDASGTVPDRVGGKTPPLVTDAANVPFTRRRAYGLRALEF